MIGRVLLAALLAGWLADQLARPDRDVEAGIEAYEAGELDVALERFEAAIARHGDRPELSLNRGLVLLAQGDASAARRAFERASEAEDPEIRASAFYERGNVAFDAEEWDAAIEAYVECLMARPDHANAKWNLELARLLEQQDEEDQDDEQDDEDQEDEQDDGTTGGDESGGSDSGTTGGSDDGTTGGSDGGETGDDTTGGSDGGETGDEGSGGSDGGGTGGTGEPPPDEGETDQPADEGGTGEPPPGEPPPLDQVDIQRALEELDEQDHVPLDRPVGGVRPPTEDW